MTPAKDTTIQFEDRDSRDEAFVFVRRVGDVVALGLCLRADGDIEVFMDVPTAQRVIDALKRAVSSDSE